MSRPVRDPYRVLGVSKQASGDEIKAAFRRLAREHHPDRNSGSAEANAKFQEINAAYQVLGDAERRARFDRHGSDRPAADPPFPGGSGGLEDLFGDLLGAFGRRPSNRGDMRQVVSLSFEEAALGCKKKLTYTRLDVCAGCGGSCAAAGSPMVTCSTCGGRGRVGVAAAGWLAIQAERNCSACGGRGKLPKHSCGTCSGKGLTPTVREIEVTVPAGIESGAAQTLVGAGSRVLAGHPAGDLEIVIQLEDHPSFRRDGDDVRSDLELPYVVAALGGEVDVLTLHGVRRLRVPEGTATDSELRLRGLGVPHRFRSGSGDHIARAKLRIPERLSQRARELIAEFDAVAGIYEDTSIIGKIRSFFSG